MEVCIVKPDRIFFKEDAEELLLPTSTGYIGILKEHAPLVTGLDNGVLALRQGSSWKILALLGGCVGDEEVARPQLLVARLEDLRHERLLMLELLDVFDGHLYY